MAGIRDLASTPAGHVLLPCTCQLTDEKDGLDLVGCGNKFCRVRTLLRRLAFEASTGKWQEDPV
ncbi:MAG: hypothetical protein QOG31_226 [Thermoplasmata archaeon]|jgi:hypothetical protein|nr:hypothetical protein [Thermoplasmata archaeon]